MNADYPAFRRYLDACIEGEDNAVTVIERAEGDNVYIVPAARYNEMREKAEAYDREHGVTVSDEDADEEAAIKSFIASETR